MIQSLKNAAKNLASKLGYRIVPKDRDAMSLLRFVESFDVSTVIDVGANDGHTSAHWLRTFPQAHVHAVEAQSMYSEALVKVASIFPGRMTIWEVAATDVSGELTFRIHEDHPSSSSLLPSTVESHELMPFTKRERVIVVQAERLDSLLAKAGVEFGGGVLVKLDVQGAELNALRGCEGFLREVVCVLCEVNLPALYEGQTTLTELTLYLEQFGLAFGGIAEQFHAPDGRAIYLDAVFIRASAVKN